MHRSVAACVHSRGQLSGQRLMMMEAHWLVHDSWPQTWFPNANRSRDNQTKAEMSRIARKVAKAHAAPVRSASTRYRSDIAELKRTVADLQRQVALLSKQVARPRVADPKADGETKHRYRADSVAKLRTRLGLTAAQLATLIGVSQQTVYSWEQGARPRAAQIEALAQLRQIGKREAHARLDASAETATPKVRKAARK